MANKWIPLDGKKEPPFNEPILIWFNNSWKVATLSEIRRSAEGTFYEFEFGLDHSTTDEASHYMLIEPPKNNQ